MLARASLFVRFNHGVQIAVLQAANCVDFDDLQGRSKWACGEYAGGRGLETRKNALG
jgi:hypothetical protein